MCTWAAILSVALHAMLSHAISRVRNSAPWAAVRCAVLCLLLSRPAPPRHYISSLSCSSGCLAAAVTVNAGALSVCLSLSLSLSLSDSLCAERCLSTFTPQLEETTPLRVLTKSRQNIEKLKHENDVLVSATPWNLFKTVAATRSLSRARGSKRM